MTQPPALRPADLAERVWQLKQSWGVESWTARIDAARALYREAFARLDAGEKVDWEMFDGLDIGIRLTPVSWDQLQAIMNAAIGGGSEEEARTQGRFADEEALGKLGRSWWHLKAYYNYRDQVITKQFASTTDYLLLKLFGVPAKLAPDGRKAAVLPPDFYDELRIVFRENDFPYFFEEGLEDHTLWANRPLSPQELRQAIEAHRPGYDVEYFVNAPSLMSVPAIWHAHVISRKRPAPLAGVQQQQQEQQQQSQQEQQAEQ